MNGSHASYNVRVMGNFNVKIVYLLHGIYIKALRYFKELIYDTKHLLLLKFILFQVGHLLFQK